MPVLAANVAEGRRNGLEDTEKILQRMYDLSFLGEQLNSRLNEMSFEEEEAEVLTFDSSIQK